MIEFTSLTLRNFLSYGNNTTIVNLSRQNTTTLIVGEDLDNTADGKGANGVGKTAIINALTYAVYDTPISNISKDNLVNNINKKNMEVVVEFKMPSGDQYTIKRARKMKAGAAGNTVYLLKNEVDITPDSANATNALIQKIIGIPYELFIRIVVFSAAHTPFLDLKAADQAAMIEELFGLTMLSEKATYLKDMIRDTESKIAIQQVLVGEKERERSQYDKQVESARQRIDAWVLKHNKDVGDLVEKAAIWKNEREARRLAAVQKIEAWESDHSRDVKTYEDRLIILSEIDFNHEQDVFDAIKQATSERDSIVAEQREKTRDKATLMSKLQTNENELEHLRDAKCPRCFQNMPNATQEIQRCETHSNEWMVAIEHIQTELAELSTSLTVCDDKIKTWKISLRVQTINDLAQLRAEKDSASSNLQRIKTAVNPLIGTDLAVLDEKNPYVAQLDRVENETNPHIGAFDELQKLAPPAPDYTAINSLTKVVEHQQFLLKLLTKKDSFVRKALLNRNIPYLNNRLQHYLSLLGLPHKVEFTHEMTARISQIGRELDFGNLSAGQAARVNFALALAFRDVLQGRHAKINVCMLDEVLDHGLDTIGVQAAARLLKRKARDEGLSLYITSHRDEIDRAFDHTMTVQLSKGFSYIIEE